MRSHVFPAFVVFIKNTSGEYQKSNATSRQSPQQSKNKHLKKKPFSEGGKKATVDDASRSK